MRRDGVIQRYNMTVKKHLLSGIPLYHGTASKFKRFSLVNFEKHHPGDWGPGIYFTTSRSTAKQYAFNAFQDNDPILSKLRDKSLKYYSIQERERSGSVEFERAGRKISELMSRIRKRKEELADGDWNARVMKVFLKPGTKIAIYNSQGITDPYLTTRKKSQGYDAILIDPGKWVEEVVVMNLNKIIYTK
jgi:hypothetical protein